MFLLQFHRAVRISANSSGSQLTARQRSSVSRPSSVEDFPSSFAARQTASLRILPFSEAIFMVSSEVMRVSSSSCARPFKTSSVHRSVSRSGRRSAAQDAACNADASRLGTPHAICCAVTSIPVWSSFSDRRDFSGFSIAVAKT